MDTSNPYKVKSHNLYIREESGFIPMWIVTGPWLYEGKRFTSKKEAEEVADLLFTGYVAGMVAGQKSIAPHLFKRE